MKWCFWQTKFFGIFDNFYCYIPSVKVHFSSFLIGRKVLVWRSVNRDVYSITRGQRAIMFLFFPGTWLGKNKTIIAGPLPRVTRYISRSKPEVKCKVFLRALQKLIFSWRFFVVWHLVYNKTLVYWHFGKTKFASGNNGGLAATKHTVSLSTSKQVFIITSLLLSLL